jgi:hypothetical protein
MTAAELIDKGIAPVKEEFWGRPADPAAGQEGSAPSTAAPVTEERKSKRQHKRVSLPSHAPHALQPAHPHAVQRAVCTELWACTAATAMAQGACVNVQG